MKKYFPYLLLFTMLVAAILLKRRNNKAAQNGKTGNISLPSNANLA
jgi:hypothetical protein